MTPRTRRATIQTTHDDPDAIARALSPDNTDEMETAVDGRTVRTAIERETTAGLHSTVDDYVVNLDVATRVVRDATTGRIADTAPDHCTDADRNADEQLNADESTNTDTDRDTDTDTNPDTEHTS